MNLKSSFTQYWEYLALKTAVKVGIFDFIKAGENTIKKIEARASFQPEILKYLLQFLENSGFINCQHKITLTNKGNILTENNPKSLKYSCLLWAEEHLRAWQNLEETLLSGKSAFKQIYGTQFFNHISDKPEKLKIYHKAMNEYARDDYEFITQKIDFSIHKSIMDIGGGMGALLSQIAKKIPKMKLFLFEKKEVLNLVQSASFEKIQGDFFTRIPAISEALILSRVIHDWSDEEVKQILSNCFSALPFGGSLYVIENFIDSEDQTFALLNLNMRVMTSGYERSFSEYKRLLSSQNFQFVNRLQLNDLQFVMHFRKKELLHEI